MVAQEIGAFLERISGDKQNNRKICRCGSGSMERAQSILAGTETRTEVVRPHPDPEFELCLFPGFHCGPCTLQ